MDMSRRNIGSRSRSRSGGLSVLLLLILLLVFLLSLQISNAKTVIERDNVSDEIVEGFEFSTTASDLIF